MAQMSNRLLWVGGVGTLPVVVAKLLQRRLSALRGNALTIGYTGHRPLEEGLALMEFLKRHRSR
jgi:hypothetical protein